MRTLTAPLRALVPERLKTLLLDARYRYQRKRFTPYQIEKTLEGVTFDFHIGDRDAQKWYGGNNSWREMRFLKTRMIDQGDVILECGAHHGCTTLFFASLVGDRGKVIAFEMMPHNADILEKNVSLNNRQNVIVERKALGATDGSVPITCRSNARVDTARRGGLSVEMTHLDRYAHLNPTMLKIDVEGYEVEVLRGAGRILQQRPKLAIEVHTDDLVNRFHTSVDSLFQILNAHGYEYFVQWEDDQDPVAYDGQRAIIERVHLFALPRA